MLNISLSCSKSDGVSFIVSHKRTAHNLKLEKGNKNLLAAIKQAAVKGYHAGIASRDNTRN